MVLFGFKTYSNKNLQFARLMMNFKIHHFPTSKVVFFFVKGIIYANQIKIYANQKYMQIKSISIKRFIILAVLYAEGNTAPFPEMF